MGLLSGDRWHEHDADEIQQHADACIEGAIKELEKAGWATESVKVIGAYSAFYFGLGLSIITWWSMFILNEHPSLQPYADRV